MIYWIVHKWTRDDYNEHNSIKLTYGGTDKEIVIEKLIDMITKELFYIDPPSEDLLEKIKKEERIFHWEWKRRGNYDAFYIVKQEGDDILCNVDNDKYFSNWDGEEF